MVRLKHRYLLVNILYPDAKDATHASNARSGDDLPYTVQFRQPSSDRLDIKILTRLIRDGVAELFGDYGSGMIAGSLQVKYFSPATSTAIIRVSRDHYRLVWAALAFTTKLPRPVDQACVMQVVRVSGTIRKAEEEAVRRARWSIKMARKAAGRASGMSANVSDAAAAPAAVDAGEYDEMEDAAGFFANGIEDPDGPDDVDEDDEGD